MSRRLPGLDQYDRTNVDDWHPDPSGGRQTKSAVGGAKTPSLPLLGAQNPTCHKCRRYVEDCPTARALRDARQAVLDSIEDRAAMTEDDWRRVAAAEHAVPPHPAVDPRPRPPARGHQHFFDGGPLHPHVPPTGSVTGRECLLCSAREVLPMRPQDRATPVPGWDDPEVIL